MATTITLEASLSRAERDQLARSTKKTKTGDVSIIAIISKMWLPRKVVSYKDTCIGVNGGEASESDGFLQADVESVNSDGSEEEEGSEEVVEWGCWYPLSGG